MAIIEHAVNNNYTMSSTGEVLYLYTGEWMGTQGQMINSSNAVANDLDTNLSISKVTPEYSGTRAA